MKEKETETKPTAKAEAKADAKLRAEVKAEVEKDLEEEGKTDLAQARARLKEEVRAELVSAVEHQVSDTEFENLKVGTTVYYNPRAKVVTATRRSAAGLLGRAGVVQEKLSGNRVRVKVGR